MSPCGKRIVCRKKTHKRVQTKPRRNARNDNNTQGPQILQRKGSYNRRRGESRWTGVRVPGADSPIYGSGNTRNRAKIAHHEHNSKRLDAFRQAVLRREGKCEGKCAGGDPPTHGGLPHCDGSCSVSARPTACKTQSSMHPCVFQTRKSPHFGRGRGVVQQGGRGRPPSVMHGHIQAGEYAALGRRTTAAVLHLAACSAAIVTPWDGVIGGGRGIEACVGGGQEMDRGCGAPSAPRNQSRWQDAQHGQNRSPTQR